MRSRLNAPIDRVPNDTEKFSARIFVFPENTNHLARHHRNAWFVNAARRHTMMFAFNDDCDAFGAQNLMDAFGDLRGHFFLYLQSLRVNLNDPGKL